MIPYSRRKLSDLNTLSQGKLLQNHTLHSGTYLYSPNLAVPPPGRRHPARREFLLLARVWPTPHHGGGVLPPHPRGGVLPYKSH